MFSLLDNTIRWYIVLSAFLYLFLFSFYGDDCFSVYNALNIYTFVSYAVILWKSSNFAERHYTVKNLGITVFAFSVLYVVLYLLISDYYADNTFMFSFADAKAYYNYSMALLERPFRKWIPFLASKRWDFDDWGAPIALTLMFHVIPSKLFVNFCYIIMNTVGAICIFKMGKTVMADRYAYIAALSYSISSYSLFFMSCFLKEEMLVFLVIATMCMLYMYIHHKRLGYLIVGVVISIAIVFFRPPVALFMWVSYMLLFLLRAKKGVFRSLAIFLMVVAAVGAFGLIQYTSSRYVGEGDVTETYQYMNTSAFQKVVLYAGAFIGPFPALLQVDNVITYKPLFGAGLLFKLLLFFAFWKGFWYVVRHKYVEMVPIYAFVVLEIFGLSVALDGLELRKAMPHVPLSILASFWFLSFSDKRLENEDRVSSFTVWTKRQFAATVLVAFGAALVWNTMKT